MHNRARIIHNLTLIMNNPDRNMQKRGEPGKREVNRAPFLMDYTK
jgi:hypothetical protein